jgi:hypothetical protein
VLAFFVLFFVCRKKKMFCALMLLAATMVASFVGVSGRPVTRLTPSGVAAALVDVNGVAAVSVASAVANATLHRINCGGLQFVDDTGVQWAADHGFNSGSTRTTNDAAITNVNSTERWDQKRALPNLIYRLVVAEEKASYRVRLHFARRNVAETPTVFNIEMEGRVVSKAYEPITTGQVQEFEVFVADKELLIELVPVKRKPFISAIEVIWASAEPIIK